MDKAKRFRKFSCFSNIASLSNQTHNRLQLMRSRRISQQESSFDNALRFLERRQSTDANFGQLQPDLYRKSSLIRLESEDESTDKIGHVQILLKHDFAKSELLITVVNVSICLARDEFSLQFSLENCANDKKVEVSVLKSVRDQTDAFKFGSEPVKLLLSSDELERSALIVDLLGGNLRGSADRLAKSSLGLRSLIDIRIEEQSVCLPLEPTNEDAQPGGEIECCLQYLPVAKRLTITIYRASNGVEGHYAFVRVVLESLDGRLMKKRKTNVRKSVEGVYKWDEAFHFEFGLNILEQSRIRIVVVGCDRIGNYRRCIGQLTFEPGRLRSESVYSNQTKNSQSVFVKQITSLLWHETLAGKVNLPHWIKLQPPSSSTN